MKLLFPFAFLLSLSLHAQTPPRLIVRGDDMGFSHAGNEALVKCFREGIETSIEVIVPSPWFPEAVKLLSENPTVDVGIHIALTSEWDNVKYRPVSNCPSLTNADGYFYPMIWPNKNYPGQALQENKWNIADIEKEMRAQITLALKKIPRISHISAHMGCYYLNDDVKALAKRLAVEYKIDIDPTDYNVKDARYVGSHTTSEEKVASILAMLEGLKPGETYLFVEHPGLDTPELRAIHHIGYENVAEDRQGVTNAWTHPRVKELIKKKGIKLISYADLKR
ncbi:polysaccharide deacetylase family protein [Chryseolinea lacunae]|uniref:Polysaccharide deacetylase family protein n=1 Tax=Chryseolinea lacunae TaxID=2801331 RepID=A0ABS1KYT7_9BACT|nr:polysaccharide deacetylase family protein [Chryseolinea lacunae]MBL0744500.1 polysaccharide deacetylase family protein [Chryseolinea lacunae]